MIAAGSVISKAVPRLQNTAYQKQIAAEYEKQGLEAPAADPEQNEDSVINRLIPEEGATLNDYSSSRFTYWKGYARELNMLGNDFSKADWDKMTQKNIYHAHNNFLEMGFRFGIPVGILFLFIELVAGCVTLGYLFMNRKKETYLIYPVIFMVAFTVGSMLEISTLPFEREIPFFFFIALAPIFDRTLNRKDKCEEPEELKEANN